MIVTKVRNYAQELAHVRSVLELKRNTLRALAGRQYARPDVWKVLYLSLVSGDGYYALGILVGSSAPTVVGGLVTSPCVACGSLWPSNPCPHQCGLAMLWVGGHPFIKDVEHWSNKAELMLEGRSIER